MLKIKEYMNKWTWEQGKCPRTLTWSRTFQPWTQGHVIVVGTAPGLVGCLVASLASVHACSHHLPVATTESGSSYCQVSRGERHHPG